MPIDSAKFAGLRRRRDSAEIQFRAAAARVVELTGELGARTRVLGEEGRDTDEIPALKQQLAEAKATAERHRGIWSGLSGEIDAGLRALAERNPRALVAELDDRHPIFLLPVRIETRFQTSGNQNQLKVRIFPDDVAITAFRRELTVAELNDAKTYWTERAKARASSDAAQGDIAARAAATVLATRYGANRGRWLASTAKPTNWDAAPPPSADALQFPAIETVGSDFAAPSRSELLPDRFVVMAFAGARKVHEAIGAPITSSVAFGPDPQQLNGGIDRDPVTNKIRTDPALAWLIDYDKAVEAGLAVTMPIDPQWARAGFDRVITLGVKYSASTEEAASAPANE